MARLESGTRLAKTLPSTLKTNHVNSTDGELLERFVQQRDEVAFSALIDRHGPMVLGVCRRVLGNEADAEDAFQSTFLVLVRKAESIRPGHMLANWLYGVAHSTALKARAMNSKRTIKERESGLHSRNSSDSATWEQLQKVLDQELRALPDKYRAAIVLCDIEGKPLKVAARELDCPVGTVGTRVARGRVMLCRRLVRQGFTLSAGALALLLCQKTATASVPPTLAMATTKAAFAFMSGAATSSGVLSSKVATLALAVISGMMWQKIKFGLAIMSTFVLLSIGGIALAQQLQNNESTTKLTRSVTPLQGVWTLVCVEHAGQALPAEALREFADWSFDGQVFRVISGRRSIGSFQVNTAALPHEINLTSPLFKDQVAAPTRHGIYKLELDKLTICLPGPPSDCLVRPTEFRSRSGTHWTSLFVLHRVVSQKNNCGP